MNSALEFIKTYFLNIKSLAGVVLILFALYTGAMEVPKKWKQYFDTNDANAKLILDKKNLGEQAAKLDAISKELDKWETQLVIIEEGDPPELAVIEAAQKVAELSESSGNAYTILQPGSSGSFDIDKQVSLPVQLPAQGGAPAATAAGGAPTAGSGGAAPAAPAPPPPPPQTKSGKGQPIDPQKAVHYSQYHLEVFGTYANLAAYIHDISSLSAYIRIDKIELSNTEGANKNIGEADTVAMKLDFTIPWYYGKNAPKLDIHVLEREEPAQPANADGETGGGSNPLGKIKTLTNTSFSGDAQDNTKQNDNKSQSDKTADGKKSAEKSDNKNTNEKSDEKNTKSGETTAPASTKNAGQNNSSKTKPNNPLLR